MTHAVSFDPLEGSGEEHHYATLEQAQHHYARLLQQRRPGILTLWAWRPATESWDFVQGHVQVFEGKPGNVPLLGAPTTVDQPLHPLALEELLAMKSDGSHHFAPDH